MQRGRALDSENSPRANCLAEVICISAAVFYAGAINPALVIRKTLRLAAARTSCPLAKHSAPPMLNETSQAALDTLAFQLLAHRRNLFQELIRRATQRTLLRPDRHDLPFGLGREERTILGQVFALAERGHRRNERDADPGTDEGLKRFQLGTAKVDGRLQVAPFAKVQHLIAEAVPHLHHDERLFFEVSKAHRPFAC